MDYDKITKKKDSDQNKINTKSISVLYVDDEKENLRVLYLLMKRKFNIYTAESADKALSILDTKKIHVILSDENMAGMKGTELLKKVAKMHPYVIKMLLTGDDNQVSVRNAMKDQDIFACINKPFDRFSLAKLFEEGYSKLVEKGYASIVNS